jgi:hypothetical protein
MIMTKQKQIWNLHIDSRRLFLLLSFILYHYLNEIIFQEHDVLHKSGYTCD